MIKPSSDYNENVFVNCPFDDIYQPLLEAIVFAIFDCGFRVRCALEEADASEIRIEKIYNIVTDCRYGVHDISRTELDEHTRLPRFNMPLELGIFLGAKKFGPWHQQKKRCLILDKEAHRYHAFVSDISGQDIEAHENDSRKVVEVVRNWLRNTSRRATIPGGLAIWEDYQLFRNDLPEMCAYLRLTSGSLIYNDYVTLVSSWLKERVEHDTLEPGGIES